MFPVSQRSLTSTVLIEVPPTSQHQCLTSPRAAAACWDRRPGLHGTLTRDPARGPLQTGFLPPQPVRSPRYIPGTGFEERSLQQPYYLFFPVYSYLHSSFQTAGAVLHAGRLR